MAFWRRTGWVPWLIGGFLLLAALLLAVGASLTAAIDANARLLSLVGEERLAVQRLGRVLLELTHSRDRAGYEQLQRGLRQDLNGIDDALRILESGGEHQGRTGIKTSVVADSLPPAGRDALAVLAGVWAPIHSELQGVVDRVDQARLIDVRNRLGPAEADLDAAFGRLLETIQADTQVLDGRLYLVLAAAAGLLVVFLAVLVWLQLRQQRALAAERKALDDMLGALPVGLFLLDRDLRVGQRYSAQLASILRRDDLADRNIGQLLDGLVSDEVLETTREFLSLLFSERVNENLVGSLNPLDQVEVHVPGETAALRRRYLSFGFRRLRDVGGRVGHLLVSVGDVTDRVVLQQELDRQRGQADMQGEQLIEVVLQLLRNDAELLSNRVGHWRSLLKEANQNLKQSTRSALELKRLVDKVYRPVHLIKGEAAALQLGFIVVRARAAEDDLSALREREGLEGNDFLPVTVRIEELFGQLDLLERMLTQLHRLRPGSSPAPGPAKPAPKAPGYLEQLVGALSGKVGKPARVVIDGDPLEALDDPRKTLLEDLLGQLARNSLVHGIESGSERAAAGKPPVGEIRYGLRRLDDGSLELSFRDDGRGVDLEALRKRAVALGRLDQVTAARLQPKELMGLIFQPGFSTATGSDDHAGRGVGLDIVADTVKRLGGRIGVQSTPGQATQFRIRLPATEVRA